MSPTSNQAGASSPRAGLSVKCFHPRPHAQLRMFCFPWAGLGASAFYRWSSFLPDEIEVLAVQYPGREDRLREAPFRRLQPLVELLAADVRPYTDQPFVFWGHSMGALVAFELAKYHRAAGEAMPGHLFVSGRQAPHLPDPVPRIPDLSDEEFVRELQRCYGGVPDVIARDAEIRSVFLPTIRADLELVYTYAHESEPPLDCHISAFGGTHDNHARDDLEAWQTYTTQPLRLHLLPGDHFFVTSQTEALLKQTVEDLVHTHPQLLLSRQDENPAG